MKPYYENGPVTVYEGDCIQVMRELPDASVHAVVTDPPYGLEFMGREWDGADGFRRSLNAADAGRENVFGRTSRTSPEYRTGGKMLGQISSGDKSKGPLPTGPGSNSRGYADHNPNLFQAWCYEWAVEALRVLKPGGHLLAFGGSRTWHRLAAGLEDAGFEIRDSIAWLYGSGFPKSLDVSKAIDKAAGAEREVVGKADRKASLGSQGVLGASRFGEFPNVTAPATDAAREWEGWGTALKPAFEPIVVARKPPVGTVAANVLEHGTGALNVDGCRVGSVVETWPASRRQYKSSGMQPGGGSDGATHETGAAPAGRWPPNVVLDESQAAELDAQSGVLHSGVLQAGHARAPKEAGILGAYGAVEGERGYGDSGGASRFFPTFRYEAKAPTVERPKAGEVQHPTVKPLVLMQWLVRLVTPPAGIVLEPFAGSGTTVEACIREGFSCIAIEREPTYLPLIMQRIQKPHEQALFGEEIA